LTGRALTDTERQVKSVQIYHCLEV
jgi:hypothetical protein